MTTPAPKPVPPMPPRTLYRYVVNDPQFGDLAAVSFLSPADCERFGGLPGQAVLAREKEAGQAPGPENLEWNGAFLELLHRVVREVFPALPEVRDARFAADAEFLFVRATRPGRTGPSDLPEDVLGRFAIEQGRMVPDRYQVHHGFQPVSQAGLFILHPEVERALLAAFPEVEQN